MTWTLLLLVAAALYAQKAVGPMLASSWQPGGRTRSALHLLAVPVLAGLIMVQTFGDGRALELDARAPAVLVAVLATWRGAPFLVVVLLAAVVAAGIRAVT